MDTIQGGLSESLRFLFSATAAVSPQSLPPEEMQNKLLVAAKGAEKMHTIVELVSQLVVCIVLLGGSFDA